MTLQRYFLADFVEIQRKSFLTLLKTGIPEEFAQRNPITNKNKTLEFFFYSDYYKLQAPEYTPKQAIFLSKSYSSKLFVPVQLIDRKNRKIQVKWVFIANLPLMTKRGHFLINGAARVVMNQITRSPGIYYHEKLHEIFGDKKSVKPEEILKRYYADFICHRGTWLRIEMDKEKAIWAQMKKGPKLPILWLLIGMGLTPNFIFGKLTDPNLLLLNFDKKKKQKQEYEYVNNPPQVWKEIAKLVFSKKMMDDKKAMEYGRKWLFKKFMNPRTYDLSQAGRFSLNKKLNLSLSLLQTTLTAQDILAATEYLIQVEKGFKSVDDIDNLQNRRVKTAGELIQGQFAIGLLRLEKNIREKMNLNLMQLNTEWRTSVTKTRPTDLAKINKSLALPTSKEKEKKLSILQLINPKTVNGALREFFGTSPLSQFMDQINPLAEITHKRRLSSLGPGGVTRDSATLAIRGIHTSHYGRICPIETPEGKNTGLVNSLTAYARLNDLGLIETPFYKVYQGQVQKQLGLIYLSPEAETKSVIAAGDLAVSSTGFLSKSSLPVRIHNFLTKNKRKNVQFLAVSPLQMISIATSLIPFLEHDDANRALMGSNMQRQAVPLIRSERPIVGTGLESRVVSDSGHALQVDLSGLVGYVSSNKITIFSIS
jgi:DNA-directed RNA polymerase subunit beta